MSNKENSKIILGDLEEKKLKDYCNFFKQAKLKKLFLKEKGVKITLKKKEPKKDFSELSLGSISAMGPIAPLPPPQPPTENLTPNPEKTKPEEAEPSTATVDSSKIIPSPIMGTFYSSPSPTSPPFVKEGDNVSVGTKVCIVEAMKIMNEIESSVAGKINKICVSDGDSINVGDPLFILE